MLGDRVFVDYIVNNGSKIATFPQLLLFCIKASECRKHAMITTETDHGTPTHRGQIKSSSNHSCKMYPTPHTSSKSLQHRWFRPFFTGQKCNELLIIHQHILSVCMESGVWMSVCEVWTPLGSKMLTWPESVHVVETCGWLAASSGTCKAIAIET